MTFTQALHRRRVTRAYENRPVDPQLIEQLVDVIRRAPSAGFAQGQRLILVTSAETRGRIAEILDGGNYDDPNFRHWMATAPVHIVVCTSEADYHERYRQPDRLINGREIEWLAPYWWIDAGGVSALLCVAAIDAGLASGVYAPPPKAMASFRELLGIPQGVEVASVVTVGHPGTSPAADTSSRVTWRRKTLDELVHRERWRDA